MRWLDKIALRVRSLFRKNLVERELADEVRFHLEQQIADKRAKGMSAEQARAAAMLEFGGVEQAKEECRDARGVGWMETLWQDVRYACRLLRKSPGFTVIAILTLALGIGANTAVFSVVDGILLRPLPYRDSAHLVAIWSLQTHRRFEGGYEDEVSPAEFQQIQEATDVFDGVTFAYPAQVAILAGASRPREVGVDDAPASFFTANGLAPALGRVFTPEDERPGHNQVAILSYPLWQQEFGGRPAAIGETIALNREIYTIVGIMPRDFELAGEYTDLWTPIDPATVLASQPTKHRLEVWARLRRGVTLPQAQAALDAISVRVGNDFPAQEKGRGLEVRSYLESQVAPVRASLLLLLGATGLVLLIACANLSNLLLARGLGRSREAAVRAALGGTRWRIARGLLTEGILVALAGGCAGLVCGWWGVVILRGLAPADTPRLADVGLNAAVFGFAFGVAVLAGVLAGLPAALCGNPVDLNDMLKPSVRTGAAAGQRRRWGKVMVGLEVALCVVLLSGALLAVSSFDKLLEVKPGFRTDHLLAMAIHLPTFEYQTGPERRSGFRQILSRVRETPGVEGVGAEINPILETVGLSARFRRAGETGAQKAPFFEARYVTEDYFGTLGIPLLRGRAITAAEVDQGARVAVINQALARRLFGLADPVGSSLVEELYASGERELQIVGVAGDVRDRDMNLGPRPAVYLPYSMMGPVTLMHLFVRTKAEPAAMAATVERQIRTVNPDIPIADVRTIDQTIAENLREPRFQTSLFSAFAVLAMALALVGIYGTVSYGASRRTQELGIRLALGARPGAIGRMVVGQAMLPVLAGVVGGLGGSLALTRLMRGMLYEVNPGDPRVLAAAVALIAVVGAIASYAPARRAMRLDPMTALRHE